MRPLERRALLELVGMMVARNEMTLGDAARFLRSGILGMSRADFARTVGVSERAIAKLEDSLAANPTLDTLTRVFAPFGAKVGLVFPSMIGDEAPAADADEKRRALLDVLQQSRRRRRDRQPASLK